MGRRLVSAGSSQPAPEKAIIPHDLGNEAAVLVSALRDGGVLDRLLTKLRPDHFQARDHRELWGALGEARRRKLVPDDGVLRAVGGDVVAAYAKALQAEFAGQPRNIEWHVGRLLWDAARASVARGPLPAFLETLRDPRSEPERVRSLARQLAQGFDGFQDRAYLHEPLALVREQMGEVEKRVAGHATYPYGVSGLDWTETGRRRMIPGAAPGEITVVTGTSGSGKSTFVANVVLGLAFPGGVESDSPGRKVLYGAWEMSGGTTLELLACISLGWSRSDLLDPHGAEADAPIRTHEGRVALQERMDLIASRVRFLGMPFRRTSGEKVSNARNLDIVQGYIADSGCDVFVGDLWRRCLRDISPEEEEDALIRQQAMAAEMRVHAILLQQQRLKDIEMRPDKRPTREGIKGSGAWTEVPDTILGLHRPALWKRMDDRTIEVGILKQRKGKWPLGVEFEWDADKGRIWGGRSIEYGHSESSADHGDWMNKPVGRRGL